MTQDQSRLSPARCGEPTDNINHPVRTGPAREGCPTVLDCPLCRRPIPRPGACRDGSTPMAECIPCDLLFDIDDAVVRFRVP